MGRGLVRAVFPCKPLCPYVCYFILSVIRSVMHSNAETTTSLILFPMLGFLPLHIIPAIGLRIEDPPPTEALSAPLPAPLPAPPHCPSPWSPPCSPHCPSPCPSPWSRMCFSLDADAEWLAIDC